MQRQLSSLGQHPLIPRRPIVRQFIKFAMVGVVNTTIDFGVYALALLWLDWHYLIANALAFVAAATNSYILNRRWTFRSQDPQWRRQASKYFTVLAIGFGLNEVLLYYFVEHGGLGEILGKAVAIVIVLFWNFSANKLWTFSKPKNPPLVTPPLD